MTLFRQLHQVFAAILLFVVLGAEAKTCRNPSVRREWRALSTSERIEWINAVKCLTKLPHDTALKPSVNTSISEIPAVNTSSSYYDDIVYIHMDLNVEIHFTGQFLPWHRAYVWGFEKALKNKCNYSGVQPYWNWTLDAPDFYNSTILDPDPSSGFGGWGDSTDDYRVTTGAFEKDFALAYPSPHNLRRNYTQQAVIDQSGVSIMVNTSFTKENVDYMVNSFVADYRGFQTYFEGGPHPGPHIILGGDMAGTCPKNATNCVGGPKWSSNDPLFFLHHAMVDKLWSDWQHKHPQNFWSFFGGANQTLGTDEFSDYPTGTLPFLNFDTLIPGDNLLWNNLTIWDMMHTQAGPLCYVYE